VDDGLDLRLAEALAFEADNPATLQGFLAHVAASDGELARDPDGSPGLVRIMTVHGAKGLEAPIVVLADALRQKKPQTWMVLWRPEDRGVTIPLIFGSGERKPAVIAELADRADAEELQEHLRLLYVALTRARQLLVVAGQITRTTADRRQKAAGDETKLTTWYDRIGRAMRALGATEADGAPFGPHLRLSDGDWPAPGMASAAEPAVPVPGWALAPPPPEPAPARPFTPSQPAGDEAPLKPAAAGQAAAAARGRLLHRLFERLPAVAPRARADVAMRVIAAAGFTGPEAEALLETVLQTLAHPELADLFLPQALAEAPVAGVIDGIVISGTVDRLLVAEDRVLVADFKTGATVPDVAEAAHPSHLKQMAAYRAVLRSAFPGRTVVAALVYTAAPKLLLLPDKLLDAHAPVAQGAADAI
jgi:ATP-dependent helicase/nuclease subunit A